MQLLGGDATRWEVNWWEPSLAVNAIQASSRKDARNIINDVGLGAGRASGSCRTWIPPTCATRLVARAEGGGALGRRGGRQGRDRRRARGSPTSSHPAFAAAFRALEKGFGRPALAIGCGGSIGFVEPFAKALGGVPALLIGVEDPDSNAHSENESLHLGDFEKAIRSAIHLYEELAGALRPSASGPPERGRASRSRRGAGGLARRSAAIMMARRTPGEYHARASAPAAVRGDGMVPRKRQHRAAAEAKALERARDMPERAHRDRRATR